MHIAFQSISSKLLRLFFSWCIDGACCNSEAKQTMVGGELAKHTLLSVRSVD